MSAAAEPARFPQLVTAWAVAMADLRERTRRYGFLAAMGGAVYFGYLIDAGYVSLTVARERGVLNSAWVGTLTALSLAVVLPLLGFYLVKSALERDRTSGVGEILAATPLTRWAYVAGKAASNFLYLAALVAVPAAAAALLQLLAGEDRRLELGALLFPLVWLTLPPLALTAALAVLFETVRWLRGALGNVLYFVVWNVLVVTGTQVEGTFAFDFAGLRLVHDSLCRQIAGCSPGVFGGQFTLQIGPHGQEVTRTFFWPGLSWSAGLGLHAVIEIGAAAAVTLGGALLFDRFDPARASRRTKRPAEAEGEEGTGESAGAREKEAGRSSGEMAAGEGAGAREEETGRGAREVAAGERAGAGEAEVQAARAALPRRRGLRRPRLRWFPGTSLAGLAAAELRLMTAGRSRWWWLGAAGLLAAGFAAPLDAARAGVLPAAWLWPLALWSGMGAREAMHGTGPLVWSGPRSPMAHALAIWAAGALVAAAAGAGIALRLLASADGSGLLAWLAAAAFIPSLALALGSWSRGTRLFEVVYLLLWYVGPLNRVAALDYMGVTAAARGGRAGLIVLALATALFFAAAAGRRRQAQS